MEVPALNAVIIAPQQVAGQRAPASSQRVNGVAAQQGDPAQGQQATAATTSQAQLARQAAQREKAQEARNVESGNEEPRPASGRIRFEMEEGTRVAKFFNTKDVLIYQVPPEGTIYLVRLQEESSQDQVETSA